MKIYLGVDPGLRHTGLCSLSEGTEPLFSDLNARATDVLSAIQELREQLERKFSEHVVHHLKKQLSYQLVVGMEKQLSVGGHSSALMFTVMMSIAAELERQFGNRFEMVSPLPVQLTSYMKKKHGIDTSNGSAIVGGFKQATGFVGRISQHTVDAYYLAKMAQDVDLGLWQYLLPRKEQKLYPWEILNCRPPQTE